MLGLIFIVPFRTRLGSCRHRGVYPDNTDGKGVAGPANAAKVTPREHGATLRRGSSTRGLLVHMVEVAIRASSPAVNDTFTALNCIDWLGDSLCHAAVTGLPDGIHRDCGGAAPVSSSR
jgi:Predicted membrane protein (DUF2254)